MTGVRQAVLKSVPIPDLHPTQMTVGMHEVAAKRKHWVALGAKKNAAFLSRHMIPVVLGPNGRYYIIDHHHLVRALHEERVDDVFVSVVAKLEKLEPDAFWIFLDNRGWMHPFDDTGRRRDYADIPDSIDKLTDDPFRSLAGELRRAGGFAKDTTPFSEFVWADFLRRRIKRKLVEAQFDRARDEALALAKSEDASYLPGWCGPVGED